MLPRKGVGERKMKKILHIVGGMSPGGTENFIMNVYRAIDRSKLQFDFIVHLKKEINYDDEIEGMGGRLHYVVRKAHNPIKNFFQIKRVIKEQHYDTVCRHSDNAFTVVDLLAARLAGAKRIIMHSHSTNTSHSRIHSFFRLWMPFVPTHRFACSEAAGRWMYGKADFQVIPNAIDTDKFLYRQSVRQEMRKEYGLTDAHIYGHVGSFVYAKNHEFLLKVFSHIARQDEKAVLLLVGDGELREEMEKQIAELELENRVILMGRRRNVEDFLQMFDLLLFPSRYEGFPVSLVEAQTSGLPCLISAGITREVCLTDCIQVFSLEEGEEAWAKKAMEMMDLSRAKERTSRQQEIKDKGFGIESLAGFYEKF